jgi:hypothetical protein
LSRTGSFDGLKVDSVKRELLRRPQGIALPVERPISSLLGTVKKLLVCGPNVALEMLMDKVIVSFLENAVLVPVTAVVGGECLMVTNQGSFRVVQGSIERDHDRPVEELRMPRKKVAFQDVEQSLVMGGVVEMGLRVRQSHRDSGWGSSSDWCRRRGDLCLAQLLIVD